MLAINWPRAYNVTCGHGAVRVDQSRRPARSAKLSVLPSATYGAMLSLDGANEYPLFFTSLLEGSAVPKVDAQITATIATVVAEGFNAIRLRSVTNRYDTESGFNWGVWDYSESDGSYVNRWAMSETMLVQLDKMVAWALEAGIEAVWIDLEGYDDIVLRHANQRPQGTYQGRGMGWSSEYDQMAWDVNSRIFKRVNTITGERYCDNGRIIWGFDNEVGFSNAYQRTTTNAWGGGASVRWFSKIIDAVTDTYGDNGYWRTELAALWSAWVTSSAYSASVGVSGSGGTWNGCIPTPSAFTALSVDSADRNAVLDFLDDMDVAHVQRTIDRCQAERADVMLCLGTWTYMSTRAWVQHGRTGNFLVDTHHYVLDGANNTGVQTGSVTTRQSLFNSGWTYVTNGYGLTDKVIGQRTASLAFAASEEGQFGPNGWRYERMALSALMSCRHRYPIALHDWSQQISNGQLTADGANMKADHHAVASQCDRLMARCISPIVRHRFFSPVSGGTFTIYATKTSIRNKQHANGSNGFEPSRFNTAFASDGTEQAAWGNKAVVFDVNDSNTPTTDFSTFPKVLDATLAAGTYLINTATEKIHVRHDHGIQAMAPSICWFIGEMSASPVFSMALAISNLGAAITRAHLCIRSDGPWPLFEGPWMMFVHGSDYSLDLVRRGSDGSVDGPGSIGEAAWLSNSDLRVLYYLPGQQTWSNGTTSDQRLMMPESFTVALDASGASGAFASGEQEVFKIGNDGLPVRLATSFGSGITSFGYDATCPMFYGQPIARRTTGARGRRR